VIEREKESKWRRGKGNRKRDTIKKDEEWHRY
jgi:hypothetical protein